MLKQEYIKCRLAWAQANRDLKQATESGDKKAIAIAERNYCIATKNYNKALRKYRNSRESAT